MNNLAPDLLEVTRYVVYRKFGGYYKKIYTKNKIKIVTKVYLARKDN